MPMNDRARQRILDPDLAMLVVRHKARTEQALKASRGMLDFGPQSSTILGQIWMALKELQELRAKYPNG